jgi:3-hydroxyisobutyrate dehydrogenase-like beta-hydroxyacid dehydrogenase
MIGVGKIGLAMTKNIMKAGYKMNVYDPNIKMLEQAA